MDKPHILQTIKDYYGHIERVGYEKEPTLFYRFLKTIINPKDENDFKAILRELESEGSITIESKEFDYSGAFEPLGIRSHFIIKLT